MRVTNNMLSNQLLYNLSNNLSKMSEQENQLSTGKKVHRPSDDPIGASKILKYKTDLSELDQYSRNASDAQSWLDITESSLKNVNTVMQRARELAVQAANGSNTASDRQKMASEALQLKNDIVANANATFAGRYIFSSSHTDQKFLKEDGTFNIEVTDYELTQRPVSQYQVGVGENINVMTNGLDVYGAIATPDPLMGSMPNKQFVGEAGTTGSNFKVTGTVAVKESAAYNIGVGLVNSNFIGVKISVGGTDFIMAEPASATSIEDVVNGMRNAVGGTPTTTLSSKADVYVDGAGKLIIKAKAYGDILPTAPATLGIELSGAGSLTASAYVEGKNTVEATVTGTAAITDFTSFKGKSYVINYNNVVKTITIPTTATVNDATQLQTELQTQINSAFGNPSINVSQTPLIPPPGDGITFTTASTPNGITPSLEVRAVVSTTPTLVKDFNDFIEGLQNNDPAKIGAFIGRADYNMNEIQNAMADIGGRTNRLDLVSNRISENDITFTKLLSDSEDADIAEVIMNMKNSENVYKAALAAGSNAIKPNLLDFLR